MRGRLAACAVLAAVLATPAAAAGPSAADRAFVRAAAQSSRFEVVSAQLAPLRLKSQTTRGRALRLQRDHTLALAQLKKLAATAGVAVPATPSPAQQKVLAALRAYKLGTATRNGKSFDEAFAEAQIAAHRQAIALFRREAASGRDATLRAWAKRMVGMLRAHLQTAQEALRAAPQQ